jgi:RNA polymerase sigma-70 factor (ECF subfamily)
MNTATTRSLATRRSLIERLPNWADRTKWQEFFDTYSELIYRFARRSGLTDAEADDVVQETMLGVARNITRYDPGSGSFKAWLLQLTRWRIGDQIRKRGPAAGNARLSLDGSRRDTAIIDRLPDAKAMPADAAWDQAWKQSAYETALQRLKLKVSAKHYQIFDCLVLKRWPVSKVAAELRVHAAQIYLVKHRLAGLLKKEVAALERTR